MIRTARKRTHKQVASSLPAKLPKGVKVVPAPTNALERELLAGPDIETSGGARTVHYRKRTH